MVGGPKGPPSPLQELEQVLVYIIKKKKKKKKKKKWSLKKIGDQIQKYEQISHGF